MLNYEERWYCTSCNTEHDADVLTLHRVTARATHEGAEVSADLYACNQWSPATLHRAAAETARQLLASLRGDA